MESMESRIKRYGFDVGLDRTGTNSQKWDAPPKGVLPLWVADMDFPCAPAIVQAIEARAKHPAFGYTHMDEQDYAAVIGFYGRRHGWTIEKEQMLFTPGVVDSLLLSVQAFTEPGDKVLIQTPVYGPFFSVVKRSKGRQLVENPLRFTGEDWEMDFEDLDKKLPGCKLMLLCSPHNPSGRVWKREALEQVLALCKKHGVLLAVDEIHCDFVFTGHTHVPLLSLPGTQTGVVAAVSATKSFNIAGLKHSTLVCPDEELRKKLQDQASAMGMGGGNMLAVCATTAAYSDCDEWMDTLLYVLEKNRDIAVEALNAMGLPALTPQGTYLVYADMRALAPTCEQIDKILLEKAKVMLNRGTDYGALGEGYMRLNLACPATTLQEALDRIQSVCR